MKKFHTIPCVIKKKEIFENHKLIFIFVYYGNYIILFEFKLKYFFYTYLHLKYFYIHFVNTSVITHLNCFVIFMSVF